MLAWRSLKSLGEANPSVLQFIKAQINLVFSDVSLTYLPFSEKNPTKLRKKATSNKEYR